MIRDAHIRIVKHIRTFIVDDNSTKKRQFSIRRWFKGGKRTESTVEYRHHAVIEDKLPPLPKSRHTAFG